MNKEHCCGAKWSRSEGSRFCLISVSCTSAVQIRQPAKPRSSRWLLFQKPQSLIETPRRLNRWKRTNKPTALTSVCLITLHLIRGENECVHPGVVFSSELIRDDADQHLRLLQSYLTVE